MARLETKIRDNKYKHKQDKIAKWTDEYAMKLCAEVLIKDMIKYSKSYDGHEEFEVAEWCDTEYGVQTIRDFITKKHKNNDLQSWGYKIPRSVERIEKLTDLLKQELEKHKEIKCEYMVNERHRFYCRESGNYKKTLIVKMNLD